MVPFVFTKWVCTSSAQSYSEERKKWKMVTGRIPGSLGRAAHRWVRPEQTSHIPDSNPDDEKFLFKHELKVEQVKAFARQNARDIIAVGFNLERTFIFSDYSYLGGAFYENVSKISRQITYSQAKATFGFTDSSV
jgi:hypothetical protein